MIRGLLFLALFAARSLAAAPPEIGGCEVFPAHNVWNTAIDRLPVDPNSDTYVATIGAQKTLVPDFGTNPGSGIPFVEVSHQAAIAITFSAYGDESDPGPYPIPLTAPIEGGAQSRGDRHAIAVDRDTCKLYELFHSFPQTDGTWRADSGAIWNLKSNAFRPLGWTSADAAGFAIMPGLVRYEEVASGVIRHAVRFTVPQTRREYVWPATHFASQLTGSQYPPMGQRFRLKRDFDMSGFSPQNQVILRALQHYGMLLADNGSAWFISGAPDGRWNNTQLRELRRVRGSDFEAVDESSLETAAESGAVRRARPPRR